LQDLRALILPQEASWNNSGQIWLLDIYDWDLVLLNQTVSAALSFGLRLCFGLFPCKLWIKGQPAGKIQRQGAGYISCLFSDGCETLRLEGIQFSCNSTQIQNSSLKIQGASLSIFNSSFTGCVSNEDGGVIQSFDRSTVIVSMSNFSHSRSDGFGGAITAYGGSVQVYGTTFSDTFASRGGGAIWSLAYQSCYGSSQFHDTVLQIEGSAFSNCTTRGDGGAILASSDTLESKFSTEKLSVIIKSSSYSDCQSSGLGGAIHLSGYSVIANLSLVLCSFNSAFFGGAMSASNGALLALSRSEIHNNAASESGGGISVTNEVFFSLEGSKIHDNLASGCGGAISANNSELVLTNCELDNNRAFGFGGGALFLKESSISCKFTSCSGNRVPSGGGGALLSQGSAPLAPEVRSYLCKQENYAVYGICAASESKSLKLLYQSSEQFWAGVTFKLAFAKLDAYQNIILTDNSLVQLMPSSSDLTALEDKNSSFSFVGSSISQFIQGYASFDVAIKPIFVDISADEAKASIQTQPHIFVQSTDFLTGATIRSDIVSIKLGEGGNACPQGYVLDLDSINLKASPGLCKQCQTETYSVSPLPYIQEPCLSCPAGAVCPDGTCVFHSSLSNRICHGGYKVVGDWAITNSSKNIILLGCPPGYSVSLMQCELCPASFYCTGGNVPSRPCPSYSYTPPGANSSASCVSSVFVSVAINVRIKRPEFKDNRLLQFRNDLANFTRWDSGYITIKVVQSGDDPETTTVTSDMVASNAKEAAALVEVLKSRALVAGLASYSDYNHEINLISLQVTHCVSGYELNLVSKMCQLCPANYICVGSNKGREACPANRGFSPPGSNESASCTPAVFITLVLSIPILPGNVTDTLKSKLIAAISSAADIASERVEISLGGAARRKVSMGGAAYVRGIAELAAEDPASPACSAAAQVCQLISQTVVFSTQREVREGEDVDVGMIRRADSSVSVLITAKLAAENAVAAAAIITKLSQPNINTQFLAIGLPQSTLISVSVPESIEILGQSLSAPAQLGISIGAIVLLAILSIGGYCLVTKIRRQKDHAECVAAISGSVVGTAASNKLLPQDLRKSFAPDIILGNCVRGNGCVVQAKPIDTDQAKQLNNFSPVLPVAIKIVTPLGQTFKFKDEQLDQLRREVRVLALLSERKCEYSVQLFLGSSQGAKVYNNIFWYIMDLLKGDNMSTIVSPGKDAGAASEYLQRRSGQGASPVASVECINVARDVLAALKVVHGEGMLHLNIQPSNIFRCKTAGETVCEGREFTYKLIGFGTVQDSDDTAAKIAVASAAGRHSSGAGMLPYMSPEMFQAPGNAMYPADLWSLGSSMFELVTGTLPFQPGGSQNWKDAISGNMAEKAPSILGRIDSDRRSKYDCSLASVISKALEKEAATRYVSTDDMHGAVFGCLVVQGKASFSVYLSYRAESDRPLAQLLFDELNHSKTPGGHRVTVYFDFCGEHGQVVDWDADIAKGLLHSICYVPILSYGATAPLAHFTEGTCAQHIAMGWEEAPLGLSRLGRAEQDREDALLKEMLVAGVLLERSSESGGLLNGERDQLRVTVPVFAGRQHPQGHPEYPCMGDYFDVNGGGGNFSMLPSPSTSQAAARFLLDRAGLPVDVTNRVQERSVASVVSSLTNLQGCCLWNQSGDLREAALTSEQKKLVGKGYAGPPVNLNHTVLSAGQVTCPPYVTPVPKMTLLSDYRESSMCC
jgi:serine/threonine protein kinase